MFRQPSTEDAYKEGQTKKDTNKKEKVQKLHFYQHLRFYKLKN